MEKKAMYPGGLPGGSDTSTLISEGRIGIDQAKMRGKECYKQKEKACLRPEEKKELKSSSI